jgi:hypothetical protein
VERHEYIERTIRELICIALPVAKPKALYEVSYVTKKNKHSLCIDGVRFTSRVLRVNLNRVERVFPFVVTCGVELNSISVPTNDLMRYFCFDTIKEEVLRSAIDFLKDYIETRYALPPLSMMNPGSLKSWPITQQKKLFSIFGNVEALIGVKLTKSSVMVPLKSTSGIFFPTEVAFESCQLCPRKVCIERRAPYDPDLAKKY